MNIKENQLALQGQEEELRKAANYSHEGELKEEIKILSSEVESLQSATSPIRYMFIQTIENTDS